MQRKFDRNLHCRSRSGLSTPITAKQTTSTHKTNTHYSTYQFTDTIYHINPNTHDDSLRKQLHRYQQQGSSQAQASIIGIQL